MTASTVASSQNWSNRVLRCRLFIALAVMHALNIAAVNAFSPSAICTRGSLDARPYRHVCASGRTSLSSYPSGREQDPRVPTALSMTDDDGGSNDPLRNDRYGYKRGAVLLALVGLFNVWLTTLPPELRGATICAKDWCERHPNELCDCVSFDTWKDAIISFYQNGGVV
uniref:Uncharacterized protein n=1 Tax=Trieres chinensis TaxID=1514140 RepID=A0A7S2A0X6_TRICV|mmetsp:Transcript_3745/g.7987  ORF Transcript_3745/g.7987 Transcript_3745/m.7987 type:complete len:169 (+) Transcript_3745:98-604(+)|eukprot:CAMPEP_0183320820 /NCGR_PEP_ID=MMETSP0160_2-20130417/67307_1 /TAXON_ID=2839 ORGANISM="Odontella Sinensis, Strain Grunow 1884" /NCGR_SAMPLE_ID=MMETSP0160_2 /ASSEMBLY_ACC=CAM_ASM_000250 /LENGTH=168 /DNA_ID=CAMNT_0025487597 /DNA_START=45 /DNA_END=551 /DNA_ORIENTATION=-